MRGVVALAAAVLAAVVLSACGSSGRPPVYAPHGPVPPPHGPVPAPHVKAHGRGSIVFVAGARSAGFGVDNTELVATTPSGGVRDLTLSAAFENNARWSADGSHVVFARQSIAGPPSRRVVLQSGLYVWSPGHGAPQRIASCSNYCAQRDFAWSPDNRQIALDVLEGDNASIEVMNADGSGVHTVCDAAHCGQGLAEPMWSPNGRRLAFSNEGVLGFKGFVTPSSAIWIANADGSGVKKLTQPNCNVAEAYRRGCAIDTAPTWSPNGQQIAFTRQNLGDSTPTGPCGPAGPVPGAGQVNHCARAVEPAMNVDVMRADGSRLHSIYSCSDPCAVGPPAWAPDGKAIAYASFGIHHPSPVRITTLAGKTSTIRTCVGSHCLYPFELTWSPSGKQLAFVAALRPVSSVWVIDRDGSGLHRVAPGGQCCLQWVGNTSLGSAKAVRSSSY